MILDQFLINLLFSIVFIILVSYIHKRWVSKYFSLPYGVSLSLILVSFVSIYACYYTHLLTSMLPILVISLYILFQSFDKEKSQKDEQKSFIFFVLSYVFHLFLFLGLVLYKQSQTNNILTLQKDYAFYINEILQIKKHGIETVYDYILYPFAAPYHYIDLWIYGFFNELPFNFATIVVFLIFPFISALIALNIIHISQTSFNLKTWFLANSSLYIYVFFFPFMSFFVDLFPIQMSIFSYPKLILIAWIFSIVLYFLFGKKIMESILLSGGFAISYVTLLPGLFSLSLVLFLEQLRLKKLKEVGIIFSFAVLAVIFSYLLYADYLTSKANFSSSDTPLSVSQFLKTFILFLIYPAYYLPYIAVILFSQPQPNNSSVQWLKNLLKLPWKGIVFMIIGCGLFGSMTQFKLVDFNQIYFNMLISLAGIVIALIWIKTSMHWKVATKFGILILFIYMVFANSKLYSGFGELPYNQRDGVVAFIKKHGTPTKLAFTKKMNYQNDFYELWPDFFAPNHLFVYSLNLRQAIDFFWIDTYNNDLPQDYRYYSYAQNLLSNTPFQRFLKNSEDMDFENAQVSFVKKYKCNYLVAIKKKISSNLKGIVKDSVQMEKGITLYALKSP